jgi:hypothetical protein
VLLLAEAACETDAVDWPTAVVLIAFFAMCAIVGWAMFR